MLDRAYNKRFRTIKTNLENNMTCGSDRYPQSKDETVGLLNNYHVSKQLMRTTLVKEEVAFTQTNRNTNMSPSTG